MSLFWSTMGGDRRYHNNKADTEVIKGNVACKDAVTMQLWHSKYIYKQEPKLFEPQCSHYKMKKCHLSSQTYSTCRLSHFDKRTATSLPQSRNFGVIHNLSFSLILPNGINHQSCGFSPQIYLKSSYFSSPTATV